MRMQHDDWFARRKTASKRPSKCRGCTRSIVDGRNNAMVLFVNAFTIYGVLRCPKSHGSISSRPWWGSFGTNEESIRERRDATAANDRTTRRLDVTRKREAPLSPFVFASALYNS